MPKYEIKYQDHEDSELYSIIETARTQAKAENQAVSRILTFCSSFTILRVEAMTGKEFHLKNIKNILGDDETWLKRNQKVKK